MRIVSELHKSLVKEIYDNPELIEKGMTPINYEQHYYVGHPREIKYVIPDILCRDSENRTVIVEVSLSLYGLDKTERCLSNRQKFLDARGGGRIIYVVKKPPRKTSYTLELFEKYGVEFKLIDDVVGSG